MQVAEQQQYANSLSYYQAELEQLLANKQELGRVLEEKEAVAAQIAGLERDVQRGEQQALRAQQLRSKNNGLQVGPLAIVRLVYFLCPLWFVVATWMYRAAVYRNCHLAILSISVSQKHGRWSTHLTSEEKNCLCWGLTAEQLNFSANLWIMRCRLKQSSCQHWRQSTGS